MIRNEKLVAELVKLNILYIREMERRKVVKIKNMGQLYEPLGSKGQSMTYGKSVRYLKDLILKNSNIELLKEKISVLEEKITNSEIKGYKCLNGSFDEEENRLDSLIIKRLLFMENGFLGVKLAAQETGIPESTIKHACQEERLLNTKKIGNTWLVHYYEVLNLWNLNKLDEKSLYYGWEY